MVVPAFTGLGSPHWDPGARGTIVGLSRGTGRAHLARAMVEAMGFQVRDVLEAMAASRPRRPRSCGSTAGRRPWACCCSWWPTRPGSRWCGPPSVETTALGAATLAGLAEGRVGLPRRAGRAVDRGRGRSRPRSAPVETEPAHAAWLRAVDRSRHWAGETRTVAG